FCDFFVWFWFHDFWREIKFCCTSASNATFRRLLLSEQSLFLNNCFFMLLLHVSNQVTFSRETVETVGASEGPSDNRLAKRAMNALALGDEEEADEEEAD